MGGYVGTKAVNLSTTAANVSGNATIGGNLTVQGTTVTIDSANAQTVDLGDNDKIQLGDGDDLQIYHDGSDSLIVDNGTGGLKIGVSGTGTSGFYKGTGSEVIATFEPDGPVTLYHNNAAKLATTSFGAQVTGSLAVDTITNATANTDVTIDTNFDIILDAGGNVGIGVTNPNYDLSVGGSSGSHYIQVRSDDSASTLGLLFADAAAGNKGAIFYDQSAEDMFFRTSNSERMRIDSNGKVGIGLSNAAAYYGDQLVVNTPSEGGITMVGPTNSENYLMWADGTSGGEAYRGYIGYSHATDALRFGSGAIERMRIDSSGNVLVGKTSTSSNVAGHRLNPRGDIEATRSGGLVAFLNRQSSDGDIAVFAKDGTTVGSIGANGGNLIVQGSTATGKTGIKFGGAEWIPQDNGNSDGGVDLGGSSYRFKDLYLSGGIQFDSRSNKLDDYEEGTWTPVVGGSTSTSGQTYGVQLGTYIKIGAIVKANAYFSITNIGTVTGAYAYIMGLPFTVANYSGAYPAVNFGYHANFGINHTTMAGYGNVNSTFCYITYMSGITTSDSYLTPAALGSQPSGIFTITYKTDQ